MPFHIIYEVAYLSQLQDNQEKVIAYMSKALNKEEQNYCVTRKELLAVVSALSLSQSCTALVFSGSVLTSFSETMWPKNLTLV
jgi:hypothetical protein